MDTGSNIITGRDCSIISHIGFTNMPIISLLLATVLLSNAIPLSAGNRYSDVTYPLLWSPEVIGSSTAGCILGAMELRLIGDGYQAMYPSRNRHYGHPTLIRFLEQLSRYVATTDHRLLIGDLGQPYGGPMPSGHQSHQTGLDADIWFFQPPITQILSNNEIEHLNAPSMINANEGTLNSSNWSKLYRDILKKAVLSPDVDRIFVNAIIKYVLCNSETDPSWLGKIRPWWGHDSHFHVRLACPVGSHSCQSQHPIPAGSGCETDLLNWVHDIVQTSSIPMQSHKYILNPTKGMSIACSVILSGQMPKLWR